MNGPKRSLHTGLIGSRIQASRSPAMHMTEARALGMDLVYDLFDLENIQGGTGALPQILAKVQEEGYLGVNITYPVKPGRQHGPVGRHQRRRQGDGRLQHGWSCATGRRVGHNTDWFGFAENFRRGLPGAALNRVVLLGAGGVGSAIAYALLKLGARRVAVHETDAVRAGEFIARFNDLAGEDIFVAARTIAQDMEDADGVINCTPVGMHKAPGTPLPVALLQAHQWVADVVYVPLRTELLRQASAKGCRTLEGGGMAVFQAGEALRLFTGKEPDYERMLAQFHSDARAERMAD